MTGAGSLAFLRPGPASAPREERVTRVFSEVPLAGPYRRTVVTVVARFVRSLSETMVTVARAERASPDL